MAQMNFEQAEDSASKRVLFGGGWLFLLIWVAAKFFISEYEMPHDCAGATDG
jgi:hypothetical protein